MVEAFRRPIFDYPASLRAARKLWDFNDALKEAEESFVALRDTALAPDSFEGSWGVEFRARADEENLNVRATRGKLRTDANEWGTAWQTAVNQMNNVCWAETYVAAKKLLEEKKRQEEENKNWASRAWGATVDFFVGSDEVIGSVPNADRASLPTGGGFPAFANFAHFRVGDPCTISYSNEEPGPSTETVTGEANGEAQQRQHSPQDHEVDPDGEAPDPVPEPVTVANNRGTEGGGAETCTIDLQKVGDYLEAYRTQIDDLVSAWDTVSPALDSAQADCQDFFCHNHSRQTVAALFGCFEHFYASVDVVYQSVVPNGDGTASISDAVIERRLQENGLDEAPGVLDPSETELGGMAENSGLVDDPINAATGNFFHQELDLAMPGFADAIAVRRTYNAGLPERGVFGRGWSSVFDMELTEHDSGMVSVRLDDGAILAFPCAQDGTYVPHGARQTRLYRDGQEWVVRKGFEREWFFDSAGRLSGGRDGYARWSLLRDATSITLTELSSNRSIAFVVAQGLIQSALTSDGRSVTYHYLDSDLVVVERPTGSMTYEINTDGLIARILDADGVLVVENTYDALRRAVSQLSPFGRMSLYEYGANGLFRSTDEHGGPANVMIHDRHGNLTSMLAGDGLGMRLKWDDRNRMVERRDRNGNTTAYTYLPDPARDLLVSQTGPDGSAEHREWDELDRLITLVVADGGVYELTYEGEHRLPASVTDPLAGVTRYERDANGQVLTETDADGVVVSYEWTADGQVRRVTDADGEVAAFDYDLAGRLTRTSSSGGSAEFAHDSAGRVVTIDSVDGVHRAVTYSAAGRPTACCDDHGELIWRMEYGQHGLASRLEDGSGKSMSVDYDVYGNHTRVVGVDGVEAHFGYDEVNQLRSLEIAGVTVLSQSFDGNGNRVSVTDADGLTATRTVDMLDRTKTVTDPVGVTTTMTWHDGGQLASATRSDGVTYRYDVDQLGRIITVVGPDGATGHYEYSAAGRLVARTTGAGRRTEYTYSDSGKLASSIDADGIVTAISAEDAEVTITSGDDMVTFTLDETGRIASWDQAGGSSGDVVWGHEACSVSYADTLPAIVELDRSGLASRVTSPAGAVTDIERNLRDQVVATVSGTERTEFSYDAFENLISVTDEMSDPVAHDYSPGGRIMASQCGDEAPVRATRDAAGRVTSISSDDQLLATYSYDSHGLIVETTSPDGTASADIDSYGSLVAMHDLNGLTTTYARDLDGLVTGVSCSDGTAFAFERSAAGRIASYRTGQTVMAAPLPWDHGVSKDAAGRITVDRAGRTHRYDDAGRLVESISSDGKRWAFAHGNNGMIESEVNPLLGDRSFRYNAGGQIAEIVDAAGTTTFRYDRRGRRSGEIRPDGTSTEFTWDAIDRLVSITRIGADGSRRERTIAYSGYGRAERIDDHQIAWDDALTHKPLRVGDATYFRSGMFTAEVGASQDWADGTVDDPFGYSGESGVRLGFRGELEVDGLVLMGARVYDPITRTFLSKDPASLVLTSPSGNNSYQYAYCDPVNNIDPTGRTVLSLDAYDEWVDRQHSSRFGSFVNAVKEDPWGAVAVVAVVAVAVVAIVVTGGLAGPVIVGGLAGTMLAAGGTAALVTVGFTAASQFYSEDYDLQGMAANGAVSFVAGAAGAGVGGYASAGFARFAGFAGGRGATTASTVAMRMSTAAQNPLVRSAIEESTTGLIEGFGNEFVAQATAGGGWDFGNLDVGNMAEQGLLSGGIGLVSVGVENRVDRMIPTSSNPVISRARQAVVGGATEGIVSTGEAVVTGQPVTVSSVANAVGQGAVTELIMGSVDIDGDAASAGTPDGGTTGQPDRPVAAGSTTGDAGGSSGGTGRTAGGATTSGTGAGSDPGAAGGGGREGGTAEGASTAPTTGDAPDGGERSGERTTASEAAEQGPAATEQPGPAEQPVAEEPVVAEQPVAEEPENSGEPVAEESVVAEQPVAEEPVAEEPENSGEPVAQEAVAEEPVAEEPGAEEAVVEEPVAEEPVAEEPVAEEPIAEEPVAEEPIAEEPAASEPTVEDLAPENPLDVDATGDVDIIHMQDDPTAIERLGGDPVVEARTSMVQGPDGEVNRVTWGIDADGNTVVAEFELSEVFEGADRSSAEDTATRTLDGKEAGDHGGHIAGHRFMLDQGQTNMFAQNGNFNTGAYAKLENEFADMIDRGATVQGTVRFDSFNDAGRPSQIIIEYTAYDADGRVIHTRGVKESLEFDNETGQTYDRLYGDEIDERIAS